MILQAAASWTGTKTVFHDGLLEGRADSETDLHECVLEERATTEDALHDYLLEESTERFEGLMLLAPKMGDGRGKLQLSRRFCLLLCLLTGVLVNPSMTMAEFFACLAALRVSWNGRGLGFVPRLRW